MSELPASAVGCPHKAKTARKRWRLWEAQGRRCHWCSRELKFAKTTLDHLHPKCLGGSNAIENLVAACRPCNMQRAKRGHSLDYVPTHNNGRKWGVPGRRKARKVDS